MLGDKLYENLLERPFRSNEQVGVSFYAIPPEVIAGLNYKLAVNKIKQVVM